MEHFFLLVCHLFSFIKRLCLLFSFLFGMYDCYYYYYLKVLHTVMEFNGLQGRYGYVTLGKLFTLLSFTFLIQKTG